jgi:hypothetical protein
MNRNIHRIGGQMPLGKFWPWRQIIATKPPTNRHKNYLHNYVTLIAALKR